MKSKKIISVILASIMAISFCSCGKDKTTTKITEDLTQPSFENGTAVIEYPSTDSDGNEVVVSTVIETPSEYESENTVSNSYTDASSKSSSSDKDTEGTDVQSSDETITGTTSNNQSALKLVIGNPLSVSLTSDELKNEFITSKSDNYNISTEEAKKIANNAEYWSEFDCYFYIINTTSKRIATNSVNVEATSNIIVDKNLNCDYNFTSGNGMTICISGYLNTSKFTDDSSVITALNDMNIQLVYTLTDQMDIEDWDSVTTKTMKIKF